MAAKSSGQPSDNIQSKSPAASVPATTTNAPPAAPRLAASAAQNLAPATEKPAATVAEKTPTAPAPVAPAAAKPPSSSAPAADKSSASEKLSTAPAAQRQTSTAAAPPAAAQKSSPAASTTLPQSAPAPAPATAKHAPPSTQAAPAPAATPAAAPKLPSSSAPATQKASPSTPSSTADKDKSDAEASGGAQQDAATAKVMEKIKDVDGVRLMSKRHSSSMTSPDVSEEVLQAVSDIAALPASAASKPEPGKKVLTHDLDVDRYRKLVKGVVPLRSSIVFDGSVTSLRRKSVHFSDTSGYNLSTVRNYERQDEAPTVPLYATAYLNLSDDDIAGGKAAASVNPVTNANGKMLRTGFTQPGVMPDFIERVRTRKVSLEFCVAHDREMSLNGTVRVANVSFHKAVFIRYTFDKWKSNQTELKASFIYTSEEETDRFSFTLRLPQWFDVGHECEFAIRFDAGNVSSYWDNNFGQNYRVSCHTRGSVAGANNRNGNIPPFPWQQVI